MTKHFCDVCGKIIKDGEYSTPSEFFNEKYDHHYDCWYRIAEYHKALMIRTKEEFETRFPKKCTCSS